MIIQNNPWEDPDFKKETTTSLEILNKHVDLLNKAFMGMLHAEVTATEGFDEKSEEAIVYHFYVYAPFLGNIRTNLFNVKQPLKSVYPVYIKNRLNDDPAYQAKNLKDFEQKLNSVILSNEVKRTISNLLSQSRNNPLVY